MGTYVNNLRLLEITTGDESGTWGTKTNTNLELIADAFGSGTEAITTNADTHTTTIADGAADEGRAIFLKYTGTLDSACTITIAPDTVNKLWFIENATSGSQNIIISQGSGANITIGNGNVAAVYTDGAGSGAAVLDAFADLELSAALTVAGAITGSSTIQGTTITATTAFVPDASDGAALGTSSLEFSDLFLADGAVVSFGDDDDVTLTHVADTGLLLSSTDELQFGDAASRIYQSSDGILRIDGETILDLYGSTSVNVSNDLKLNSDASVLGFGVDNDVTLTHVADTGLLLNSTMAIQFNDASQYINAPSATVLDINATDEIELNATAVDLNGTLDVSGTSTLTGNVSAGADIIIGATDKLRLDGSASGNTYLSESSADVVTLTTEGLDSFRFASSGGNPYIRLEAGNTGVGAIQYYENDGGSGQVLHWQAGVRGADNKYYISENATIHSSYALMASGQDVTIGGALAKGSGSFKIDHPLPSMKDTHDLYHSFIEGPRADLIYRGQIDLVDGQATVEMNAEFGMTAGTWELLCRDATCFTTNETGWDMVKGSVSGSTLTIQCQESDCTDTVSWMVVAERQDQHMYDTEWTDSDGRPILEREKPEEVEDL
tara:strand:+ start:1159 stop:2991 length:1833 start_codon:yes stop_codon:yes gene_type:complete